MIPNHRPAHVEPWICTSTGSRNVQELEPTTVDHRMVDSSRNSFANLINRELGTRGMDHSCDGASAESADLRGAGRNDARPPRGCLAIEAAMGLRTAGPIRRLDDSSSSTFHPSAVGTELFRDSVLESDPE